MCVLNSGIYGTILFLMFIPGGVVRRNVRIKSGYLDSAFFRDGVVAGQICLSSIESFMLNMLSKQHRSRMISQLENQGNVGFYISVGAVVVDLVTSK